MLEVLRDRTLKIGSAGKMFSLTGWKVGFACGAPALMDQFAKAHQFLTFTTPPNLQRAVTYALGKPRAYFEDDARRLPALARSARSALEGEGFVTLPAKGAYFRQHRSRRLRHRHERRSLRPHAIEHGVATIPVLRVLRRRPARRRSCVSASPSATTPSIAPPKR